MNSLSSNGGGDHSNHHDPFQGRKLEFPVSYQLKAVMDATISDDQNKAALFHILNQENIPYRYMDKKISTSGTYVSFTIHVELETREQMNRLYEKLTSVPGLKFAL